MRWFFLLLLTVFNLAAEETNFRLDGQADPSSYIHGCVSVITGSFNYSFSDISIDGPVPLSFVRHYCSNNHSLQDFGEGFTHNHPTKLDMKYM